MSTLTVIIIINTIHGDFLYTTKMSTSTLYVAKICHLLLKEDIRDGSADLHSYTVLLEHVKKWQETLLEGREKKQHWKILWNYLSTRKDLIVWGHGDRLTIENRTEKLWKYRRIFLIADCSCKPKTEWRWTGSLLNEQSVSQWAAYLRISILKCPVRGHVFDDVSQDGIDFTFLGANKRTVKVYITHNVASVLFRSAFSLWSVGRWTPPRSQHSWCNPKKTPKTLGSNVYQQ